MPTGSPPPTAYGPVLDVPLLRYTLTGGEPAGSYAFLTGLTPPGTLDLGEPMAQVPFTVEP